jgi:hypothetical protein
MRAKLVAALAAVLTLAVTATADARSRWAVVRPYNAKLNRMAQCESDGRWFIATGNGFFGGLQFTYSTWRSVGGWGMPHRNSVLEQKYRAVLLIRREGYRPWPRCGYA